MIRSKLDYDCIVYGSARQSYIKQLGTVHEQGIRLCLGALRTSPVQSLYVEAYEPSLGMNSRLSLQYCVILMSTEVNPAYSAVFQPWKLIIPTVCFDLCKYKKSETDTTLYCLYYSEFVESFTDYTHIFTDVGSQNVLYKDYC